ncbi:MAG: hypothetical protein J6I52_00865 [Prevotella sp.]|nr:hypothetical protein [Prevotella sp.]MBQ3630758.1 hypothetical protein [Prevotella sp.]
MAKKDQKGRHDPIKIYADAVKLQNVMMRLLVTDTARAYRYTVVEELFRMSTRLVETVDMMNMLHGQERLRSLLEVGALVRTVQTTVGNLVVVRAINTSIEADIALIIEALESQARSMWWETKNAGTQAGKDKR